MCARHGYKQFSKVGFYLARSGTRWAVHRSEVIASTGLKALQSRHESQLQVRTRISSTTITCRFDMDIKSIFRLKSLFDHSVYMRCRKKKSRFCCELCLLRGRGYIGHIDCCTCRKLQAMRVMAWPIMLLLFSFYLEF